jgi:predicted DNA-binding WGR domain protein
MSKEKGRRFEYINGSSRKFWYIAYPMKSPYSNAWVTTATFGRIGSWGQTRQKFFDSKQDAEMDRVKRINEKLKKGYHEVTIVQSMKLPPMLKPKKECQHDNLKRSGNDWKCVICKQVIEFSPSIAKDVDTDKKARRFFNLNWRKAS